ncbi:MAG: hypothetical protein ACRCTY_04020, partial [Candidatus Adiutrix sp.]
DLVLALTGDKLNLKLNIEIERNLTGEVLLGTIAISSQGLGGVELQGQLGGLLPKHFYYPLRQLLVNALNWQLHHLSLEFSDLGFMAKLYHHLELGLFFDNPQGLSAPTLLNEYFAQLAAEEEQKKMIANLAALLQEIKFFIEEPKKLKVALNPSEPLSLRRAIFDISFIYLGIYDIIDKLHLMLTVNNRSPVSLIMLPGVNFDLLPSSPRPMNNLFEEDLD